MFLDSKNYESLKRDMFNDISLLTFIPLDIETTGLNCWFHKPLLLIIKGDKQTWVLDLRTIPKKQISSLLKYIGTEKTIVGHNLKFDCKFLTYHYNVKFKSVFCTYVNSRLIWNGIKSKKYSLKYLTEFYIGEILDKEVRNSFINKPDDSPFTEEEIVYAEGDVKYLLDIKLKIEECLVKYNMEFLSELENKFLLCLVQMELEGVKIDHEKWTKNIQDWEAERLNMISNLDKELFNLSKKFKALSYASFDVKVDEDRLKVTQKNLFFDDTIIDIEKKARINWSSPTQIKQIAYYCQIFLDSTGEDALLEYNKKNIGNPLEHLFELLVGDGNKVKGLRQIEKLLSTYGETFFKIENSITGKIHTSFSQVNTETGRLSSGDTKSDGKKMNWGVNLQNIPADNKIRNCFIPDEGYLFCSSDLSGKNKN